MCCDSLVRLEPSIVLYEVKFALGITLSSLTEEITSFGHVAVYLLSLVFHDVCF